MKDCIKIKIDLQIQFTDSNRLTACAAMIPICRSQGFALAEYIVPRCVEDGAWMLWGNSSIVVTFVAFLARPFLDIS